MIEFSEEGRRWVIKRTKMSCPQDDCCPLCKTLIGEKEVEKLMERKTEVEILGSKLFLDKHFLDLKIICEGKEFECHKNVLCCQIDYTQSLLQGAAEPNQIFTCSIDGVGQSFSEKNECCFLRQIN